ncbi:hypothetical protein VVR12_03360 [Rothia sp. LK2588]|uniref:hypothetical protein n=1 Tax=Rothia sp. LK2588 TaxID=3114369 RepID=UPI0034CF704E
MVGYKDQRPTRRDSLIKRMSQRVDNKQTVPHGVKVARPYEATVYQDTSGGSWRWDGDTVASFDSRIQAARDAVDAAKARLDKAEADLTAASGRIDTTNSDLSALDTRVTQAQADLSTAQQDLNQVQSDVSAVESAVTTVDQKATTAQSSADAASKAAQDASSVAATADQKATTAQSTADAAKSAAATADQKALDAAGLAGSKGKVIYQVTAPTGSNAAAANLWIRSTDNVPFTYDATAAKWVPVTDQTAKDAATAAAAAQTAANTAQAAADKAQADATKAINDAAAAASTAQQAQVAAGNAQKSADGKNVVQYGTVTPPPNLGVKAGDTYYYVGSDYRIIEVWSWNGSNWTRRKIEAAQLANLDAGYITSGYLDVAKRIQAGSIFADKLTIGLGDNIMPPVKPTANMPGVPAGTVVAGGMGSSYAVKVPASTSSNGYYLASPTAGDYLLSIEPFTQYRAAVYAKSATTATAALYVRFVDSTTGTWSFGTPSNIPVPVGTSWTLVSGTFTPPNDGKTYDKAYIGLYAPLTHDSEVFFSDPSLRQMKDGSLIVNGSITGDQINANSVTTKVVNTMDANMKRLIVTEDALLNNATFLGTTVADQLNVRKLIRGRDAIISGTLDVTQLNVTGEMSAAIVNAMDLTAKKLVVTDETIMNRATIVEGIITPEIVATRVNSALVTGSVIQTSSAASTGVKIDSNGYKAYDSNNRLSVDLNGKSNLITGMLQTSTTEENVGRVVVGLNGAGAIDLYKGNVTTHGAIWYSEVGTDYSPGGSLKILGVPGSVVANDTPGFYINPGRGSVDIRGSLERNGQAKKFTQYENPGIAGGGYVDFTITWPEAFPIGTVPFIAVSPSNANKCEMSWVVLTQDRFGATIRLVNNVSTRGTGYVWARVTGEAYNQ